MTVLAVPKDAWQTAFCRGCGWYVTFQADDVKTGFVPVETPGLSVSEAIGHSVGGRVVHLVTCAQGHSVEVG